MPLINYGHIHFGENKVQEATAKWRLIKNERKHLKLHMIEKLQSNKAKNAGELFDYIHSLDTQKLADILSDYQLDSGRNLNILFKLILAMNFKNLEYLSELKISITIV